MRIVPILARVFQARQSGTVICTALSAAAAMCDAPGNHTTRLINKMVTIIAFLFMNDSFVF